MKKQFIILSLLGILVSGCATYATGPLFTQAPAPTDHKSTLYILRAKTIAVPNLSVKIDGKLFTVLTVMGYSYAYLPQGIHRLNFGYGSGNGDFITEVEIKEGQDLYIEYISDGFGQRVNEMTKAQASELVKNYRYVEPVNINF